MAAARPLFAVILAAGKGTRMEWDGPKVLYPLAGRPLLHHVVDACMALAPELCVVVVGHQADAVRAALEGRPVTAVDQPEQLGTGHAVRQSEPVFRGREGDILVVCGDVPLITKGTLGGLVNAHRETGAAATVLTAVVDDAAAYGRMVTDASGRLLRIVETVDASPAEIAIREINSGIYCFTLPEPFASLNRVKPDNKKGEYYLTDVIGILRGDGRPVYAHRCLHPEEVQGINSVAEARAAEGSLRGS